MTINVLPQLVLEPIQYKIVARNNKAAMSAIRKRKATRLTRLRALLSTVNMTASHSIYVMKEVFTVGNAFAPNEMMVNLHRFNKSKALARYRDSFWGREALITAYEQVFHCLQRYEDFAIFEDQDFYNNHLFPKESILHDEIEVINIWMIKVYNELITVRRKSHDDQIASIDNSLSCTERNPTATILYNLRTQCMFCGQGPKNEFDRLFECMDCQYAHYCSIECMEKYRAYHRLLCTPNGSEGILDIIGRLGQNHCDEIIANNRKIRKGQSVAEPLVNPVSTNTNNLYEMFHSDLFVSKKFYYLN